MRVGDKKLKVLNVCKVLKVFKVLNVCKKLKVNVCKVLKVFKVLNVCKVENVGDKSISKPEPQLLDGGP